MESDKSRLKLDPIIDLMKRHRADEAKIVLKSMLATEPLPAPRRLLTRLLSMCSHHSLKVFIIGLPVALWWYTLVAFGLIVLRLAIAAKWGPDAVEMATILDVVLPAAVYFSLRWARDRFPTCYKPEMQWAFLVAGTILMSSVLLASYWLVLLICSAVATGRITTIGAGVGLLSSAAKPQELLAATAGFALSHPLQLLATLVTVGLGFHGPVTSTTAQAVELYNEIVDT